MDLRGSLVDTNIKIYPSEKFIAFLETIPISGDVPINILRFIRDNAEVSTKEKKSKTSDYQVQYTNSDIENLNKIKKAFEKNAVTDDTSKKSATDQKENALENAVHENLHNKGSDEKNGDEEKNEDDSHDGNNDDIKNDTLHLTTSDIDWVYDHINKRKSKNGENIPYLHELFQGTEIVMPENRILKRNPVLEARCVKLRAQQEAREYRKMTKSVDNVRMRFPEDSISYQLKQLNRQLIAIGQFIISIFAGFLFGFRGVEWMVGNLDFGVRLLLGVMCALIIALAEIYFLAKKLNEELIMAETVQLGGPPKFANQPDHRVCSKISPDDKEHQD